MMEIGDKVKFLGIGSDYGLEDISKKYIKEIGVVTQVEDDEIYVLFGDGSKFYFLEEDRNAA